MWILAEEPPPFCSINSAVIMQWQCSKHNVLECVCSGQNLEISLPHSIYFFLLFLYRCPFLSSVNNVLSRSGLKTLFDPKIPHHEMPQINPRCCIPLAPAAPHTPYPRAHARKITKHAHWWHEEGAYFHSHSFYLECWHILCSLSFLCISHCNK